MLQRVFTGRTSDFPSFHFQSCFPLVILHWNFPGITFSKCLELPLKVLFKQVTFNEIKFQVGTVIKCLSKLYTLEESDTTCIADTGSFSKSVNVAYKMSTSIFGYHHVCFFLQPLVLPCVTSAIGHVGQTGSRSSTDCITGSSRLIINYSLFLVWCRY